MRRPQELRIRYDDTLGPPFNIVDHLPCWLCDAADSPPASNSHTDCKSFHLTSTPSSIYPLTGSSLLSHITSGISCCVALAAAAAALACLLRLPLPRNAGLFSPFLFPAQHAGLLLADCCLLSESELRQSRLNLSTVTFSPFSPFHTSPPLHPPPP